MRISYRPELQYYAAGLILQVRNPALSRLALNT